LKGNSSRGKRAAERHGKRKEERLSGKRQKYLAVVEGGLRLRGERGNWGMSGEANWAGGRPLKKIIHKLTGSSCLSNPDGEKWGDGGSVKVGKRSGSKKNSRGGANDKRGEGGGSGGDCQGEGKRDDAWATLNRMRSRFFRVGFLKRNSERKMKRGGKAGEACERGIGVVKKARESSRGDWKS